MTRYQIEYKAVLSAESDDDGVEDDGILYYDSYTEEFDDSELPEFLVGREKGTVYTDYKVKVYLAIHRHDDAAYAESFYYNKKTKTVSL